MRIAVVAVLAMAIALALCIYTMRTMPPRRPSPSIYLRRKGCVISGSRQRRERAFVVAVCFTVVVASLTRQTGSAAINSTFAFSDTRKLITRQLERNPGEHLVLVSYDLERHYPGDELVHNGADFNSAKSCGRDRRELRVIESCARLIPTGPSGPFKTDDVSFSLDHSISANTLIEDHII